MARKRKEGKKGIYCLPALTEARRGSYMQVRKSESFLCARQRARGEEEQLQSTVRAKVLGDNQGTKGVLNAPKYSKVLSRTAMTSRSEPD